MPTCLIVIPAYNEGNNILACVNSLKGQNFPKDDYEIIVVDNNSTDDTPDIVKNLGVIHVVEYKRGTAAAKNAGIRLAKGNIIAFVDGDCIATEGWLKNIVSGFEKSDIGCIAGGITAKEDDSLSPLERFFIRKGYLSQAQHVENSFLPFAAMANAAYRKEVFDKIGLFDEELLIGEDADLSWRMQLFTDYRVAYVPEAIVFHPYESRPEELFRQKRRHAFGSVMLYKKYKKYQQAGVKSLRETYWEYRSLIRRGLLLLFHKLQKYLWKKNMGLPPTDEHQLILETAWKVGLIQGSIRHRVWYV
jgi:cellulose synthase/poly-beta-1,6-N-acetylglucosamine synthase-like glycosyltransferase